MIPPPIILQREQIQEEGVILGAGSVGAVHMAWLASSGGRKRVAIKRNQSTNPAEELKELFAFASPPAHPNMVRFMGIVPREAHLDYVMELAKGGNLHSILKDKARADALRSAPARVARVLQGVLMALDHLHSRNFIHRDLAARNILLSTDAKLADWGASL